jgi:hypothetical protein
MDTGSAQGEKGWIRAVHRVRKDGYGQCRGSERMLLCSDESDWMLDVSPNTQPYQVDRERKRNGGQCRIFQYRSGRYSPVQSSTV